MKFNLVIKATKGFKASISAIQWLHDEATFEVNENGAFCRVLAPGNVSYVEVEFHKDKFIKFELEENVKITIKTGELMDVVKRAKNDEEVTFEMDGKINALQVYLGTKKKYILNLINEEHDPPTPKFNFQAKTEMKFADFRDYINDINIVADNFMVTTDGQAMKLTGKGDGGKGTEIDAGGKVEQNEEGIVKSEFQIENFVTLAKTLGVSSFENVIIEHGQDMPIKLKFEDSDMGLLTYIQSPKIL